VSFTERECDDMDHARDQAKERRLEREVEEGKARERRLSALLVGPERVFCVCGHAHGHHNMSTGGLTDCNVVHCPCKLWGLDDMTEVAPPLEPAVVRIAKAMAALVAALPGVRCVSASTTSTRDGHVTIQCASDEAVRTLATSLVREVREVTFEGSRWLAADLVAGVEISISGPHHPILAGEVVNDAAVTAALAQAKAEIAAKAGAR